MQIEKEKWVNDVLNSTDGMTRVTMPDISEAVWSGVNSRTIASASENNALMWRVAASVAILLVLNVVSIYSYQNHVLKARNEQQAQAAAAAFGLSQSGSDAGTAIFGN